MRSPPRSRWTRRVLSRGRRLGHVRRLGEGLIPNLWSVEVLGHSPARYLATGRNDG
jgi:hypothetical protein